MPLRTVIDSIDRMRDTTHAMDLRVVPLADVVVEEDVENMYSGHVWRPLWFEHSIKMAPGS